MCLPCLVEFVKVDVACAPPVEEAEHNLVLGVGLCEQVLEDGPVVDADLALLVAIGDLEENAILVPLNLVLGAVALLAEANTTITNDCRVVWLLT